MPAPNPSALPWRRWVLACGAGEAVGYAGAALAAGLTLLLVDPDSARGRWIAWAFAGLGGLWEGAAIGTAQARTLGPGRGATWRWPLATSLAAGLGWLLGYLPSTLNAGSSGAAEPSGASLYLSAAALGAPMGALIGAAQAWTLALPPRERWRWVGANVAAWTLAMPILFWAPYAVPAQASVPAIVAYGAVAGLGGGLVVGAVTGLARLVRGAPTRPTA